MSDKKHVLFVDDEPNILSGLKRMLRPMRHEWEMHFSGNGQEALELLEKHHFDVIVSDMRMPGMNGLDLLNEVRKKYPHMVRMALSGESAKESVLSLIGPIHQYLPKPCDADSLRFALSRIGQLRSLMATESMRLVLMDLENLPSLPSLYHDLMAQCTSPDGSLKEVGKIISQDLGMSTKVMHLVNSVFFGMPKKISTPQIAVNVLGMETVRALAVTVCVFSRFESHTVSRFSLETLWEHSLRTGSLARELARTEELPTEQIDHAFTAGLLHDVGKLVFASKVPQQYSEVLRRAADSGIPLVDIEQEILGATHPQIGNYLLGLWGFADPIIDALAYHHNPSNCTSEHRDVLTVVHVANSLERQLRDESDSCHHCPTDIAYLKSTNKLHRLSMWKSICQDMLTRELHNERESTVCR